MLATLVRLLDTTLVRVGNDEYARTNRSYGLTTLRNRHADVQGSRIRLAFRGKSGIEHEVDLDDPRVARVVRRCQAMPGQDLFQYEDEDGSVRGGRLGRRQRLHPRGGRRRLHRQGLPHLARQRPGARPLGRAVRRRRRCRRSANQLLAEVARRLGNTVAVCKKSYVHPRVLETLATQVDSEALARLAGRRRAGLNAAERRLLAFLGHG